MNIMIISKIQYSVPLINILYKRYYFCTSKSRVKIDKSFEYLYGINSVQIALNCNRRQLYQLFIVDTEINHLNSRVANIINKARKINLPIQFLPKQKIQRFSPNQPHQNVILKCDKMEYLNIEKVEQLTGSNKICVFLDQITDPQNFGAILRSCYYLNINKILVNNKNKCPLNSTVSKTSSGALQLMNLFSISDPIVFLNDWKSKNNKIYCTGMPGLRNDKQFNYLDDDQFQSKKSEQYKNDILVLLGSEGYGVSNQFINLSDKIISIRKLSNDSFPASLVDSMNVNAALAIVLYQLQKKRLKN